MQTKPQALTPDEAAEVMDQKTQTATPPEPKTPEQSAKGTPEPFYFYNVVVTVQKRLTSSISLDGAYNISRTNSSV